MSVSNSILEKAREDIRSASLTSEPEYPPPPHGSSSGLWTIQNQPSWQYIKVCCVSKTKEQNVKSGWSNVKRFIMCSVLSLTVTKLRSYESFIYLFSYCALQSSFLCIHSRLKAMPI